MSTSNNETMFSFLVSRLSNRTEDVAVEALGYILSRSDAARRALRDLLQVEGLDTGELTDAGTQVSGEGGERPDLVVWDSARNERLLIEAKFWAGLTENQPNAYLDRLPCDERPSVLLFVAPESRLATLWPELSRRIEPLLDWQPLDTAPSANIRLIQSTEGTRFLSLTSWRTLLNWILSFCQSSGDSVEADINQLIALCEKQDQEAFLPLKPHELAPEIPRRILQLNDLVDKAVFLARKQNIADTTKLNATPQREGYGRYMRLGQIDTNTWIGAWIGVNCEYWAKSGETPLWVTFSDFSGTATVSVAEARSRLGNEIWMNSKDSVPVRLPYGVEEEKALADVVEQLRELAEKIASP